MAGNSTILQKTLHFFLVKILVCVALIISLVIFIEFLRSALLDKTSLSPHAKEIIIALADAFFTVAAYRILFRIYDKRKIYELCEANFFSLATTGFLTGILLQAFFIFFIYIAGTYCVISVNPASALLAAFAFALTAGFVAEIIFIGIVFRLLEKETGTTIAVLIFMFLFAVLHVNAKGATALSIGATVLQAGWMLPASYIFSRSLWLPIFLHFGWDFAEPGIFGAVNPSTSLAESLLNIRMEGNLLFTGGQAGPQSSLPASFCCFFLGLLFLFLAKRKKHFIQPKWKSTFKE